MDYRSKFFEFFPPPVFLTMRSAGLVISDRSLRFAELTPKNGYLTLKKYGEMEIPEGVVTSGKVQRVDALQKILETARNRYGLQFVRLALPEQLSYLIKLQIPKIRKREIRSNIEFQFEEHIPISPRDAAFDYVISTCVVHGKGSHNDVGVSVIPEETVQTYSALLRNAGFTLLSIEVEVYAIARALMKHGDCGTYMLVDIGATRTAISIISEGIIRFTWSPPIGGNLLTNAVEKAAGLVFKEAQVLKEKKGLFQPKSKEGQRVRDALIPPISVLTEEIRKRYDFWHTHIDEDKSGRRGEITKIILCGGEANVPGLIEYLRHGITPAIELGNPWVNILSFDKHIPEIPKNHSLRYATVLGLALGQFN